MPYPFWIKDLGTRGEYLARRWYHRLGYHLVGRNIRIRQGEIDLIMARRNRVLFVEVKTRSGFTHKIADVLSKDQERRLIRLAEAYMSVHPDIHWAFFLTLVQVKGRQYTMVHARL
ncbi:MAG: YraN family protein [Acidobacteria bacterium]|nr:YraN family protein [Acidobacteriota bacterium]